jgi:hypothetical protein
MDPGSWTTVEYAESAHSDPRVHALRTALEHVLSNGRVLLVRVVATNAADFDAAARDDVQGLDHLLGSFLAKTATVGALADLDIPRGQLPAYRPISPFEWEGALVHMLVVGGAYGRRVPEESARQLARDFVDACLEGRHLTATVFAIPGAWTPWFHDVAWDNTFLLYDRAARAWTCLASTDTD